MSSTLAAERCQNHPHREAAALCPECRRFHCRECVTEHEGRLVCAVCLRRIAGVDRQLPATRRVALCLEALAGLALTWMLFYAAGRVLASLPSPVHDDAFDSVSVGARAHQGPR